MRPKIGEGSDAANPKISLAFQERIYLLKSNCVWVIYVLVKTPLSGEGLAFIGAGRDLIPASVGR